MLNTVFTGVGLQTTTPIWPSQSGAIYWDGSSKSIKIIDSYGGTSQHYTTSQMVQLDTTVQEQLAWVKKKMKEELDLADLCRQHPGLQDVKEKFDIMLALVKTNTV